MSLQSDGAALVRAALASVRGNLEIVLLSAALVLIVQIAVGLVVLLLFGGVDVGALQRSLSTLQSMDPNNPDQQAVLDAVGLLFPFIGAGLAGYFLAFPIFPLVWQRTVLKGRGRVLQMDEGESLPGLYGRLLARILLSLLPLGLLFILAFIGILILGGLFGLLFTLLGLGGFGAALLQIMQGLLITVVLAVYYAGLSVALAGASVARGPGIFDALKYVAEEDRRVLIAIIIVALAGFAANQVALMLASLSPIIFVLLYAVIWVVTVALNLTIGAFALSQGDERGAL